MTEISGVFCSRPGDTLEQMTATVGFVADHSEVRQNMLLLFTVVK
jgi:hypothetical protein